MIKLALFSKFQNYIPTNLPNTCQLLAKCLPKLAKSCQSLPIAAHQMITKHLPNSCRIFANAFQMLVNACQILDNYLPNACHGTCRNHASAHFAKACQVITIPLPRLPKYLPNTCQKLAKYLPNTFQTFAKLK